MGVLTADMVAQVLGNLLPPNTGVFWAELSGALRAPVLGGRVRTSRPGYYMPVDIRHLPHCRQCI